jgi:hypothetical protein
MNVVGDNMRRFDWRHFEQRPERWEGDWPSFSTNELAERYGGILEKPAVWSDFINDLLGLSPVQDQFEINCLRVFDTFLAAIPSAVGPTDCVFISHQRTDAARGVRVACIVDQHGLDSWLDVHDPTLTRVNALPSNDPRKSLLIAAIIEIALLSSKHLITLHTANSLKSRWVPYELGRAKMRGIVSTQAAGWFETGQDETTCGDYVQLAVMTLTEKDIEDRLQKFAGGRPNLGAVTLECNKSRSLDETPT